MVPDHLAQTGPVLGHLARAAPVPRILFPPRLFSEILPGPYLCQRILEGPDVPAVLHVPDRCSVIFCNLCRGIL